MTLTPVSHAPQITLYRVDGDYPASRTVSGRLAITTSRPACATGCSSALEDRRRTVFKSA